MFSLIANYALNSQLVSSTTLKFCQFTSAIRRMDNVVADALSRIGTNALLTGQPPEVDFPAIAMSQATDPQV